MSPALATRRGTAPPGARTATDPAAERRARAELRRQIARLERRLSELFAESFPRQGIEWGIGAVGGPRVLEIGKLERIRDSLALRVREVEHELAKRAEAEARKRELLERMLADPAGHRWVIVSNEDIGERGCRHWHSRPRWGILGLLFGWWRVKLSSGCPLAKGLRPPPPGIESASDGEEAAQAPAPAAGAARAGGRRRRSRVAEAGCARAAGR